MGKLTPGAELIYESPDGGKTVYCREVGTNKKHLVGYQVDPMYKNMADGYWRETFWKDLLEESERNKTLKHAVDQCILIYNLSKDHDT